MRERNSRMDNEKERNNKVISVDQLSTNGIIYEEVNWFKHSIFSDVYSNACKLVENIVKENDKLQNDIKMNGPGIRREIQNTISFIGRRGTGKTSAMLSFYNALMCYSPSLNYRDERNIEFESNFMKEVEFKGINCIDIAALEESEDIFVLVLANMLNEVLSTAKNGAVSLHEYDNRSLLQKFEKIYDDFTTLKMVSQNVENGYSSLECLKNIGNSQNVRKQFEELVEAYLKFLDNEREIGRKSKKFLVITIDDLDMYQRKDYSLDNKSVNYGSYEVMRSIQQYLSVPNVIVLAAYNHIYLYDQCLEYFIGHNLNSEQDSNIKQIGLRQNIYRNKELASQFMEKVFGTYARIYMPSWKKRDFDNENIIKIDIDTEKGKSILKLFKERKREENIITIKKFVFLLLEQKTGIYFDCHGLKKHFFEPDTFRSLYNTANFLMFMEDCYDLESGKRKFDYDKCINNMKKIKEDFFFRFAQEKLTSIYERELFEDWQAQVISRRGQAIVTMMSKNTVRLGKEEKNMLYQVRRMNQSIPKELENINIQYSLAELVHSIYHMTRGEFNQLYTRELVICILFSYTLQLTDEYQHYRSVIENFSQEDYIECFECDGNNAPKSVWKQYEKIQKKLKVFEDVIGNTVCGKWTQYYFPDVKIGNEENVVSDSYILGYSEIKRNESTKVILKSFTIKNLKEQLNDIKNGKVTGFLKSMYQILFIAMTRSDTLAWIKKENVECEIEGSALEKVSLSDEIEEKNDEEIHLVFKIKGIRDDNKRAIDLSGCFRYTICYHKLLKQLKSLLLSAIKDKKDELSEEKSAIYKEMIKESFNQIWKQYYEWEQNYGNMMLPIYSLDITYNIIKRVFLECKDENLSPIIIANVDTSDEFLQEYKKMLLRFYKHLKEIDDYYCVNGDGFSNVFLKCPFISMIDQLMKDQGSCEVINQYIYSIIQEFEVNKKAQDTV